MLHSSTEDRRESCSLSDTAVQSNQTQYIYKHKNIVELYATAGTFCHRHDYRRLIICLCFLCRVVRYGFQRHYTLNVGDERNCESSLAIILCVITVNAILILFPCTFDNFKLCSVLCTNPDPIPLQN